MLVWIILIIAVLLVVLSAIGISILTFLYEIRLSEFEQREIIERNNE